jgi:hypothetical protein
MLGIKQEALASALGDDWNQKKISLLKGKESIEAIEENKKLYERLLQTEREKAALLEKMLDKK